MTYIKKGDYIKAVWFQATQGALAGVQPKTAATRVEVYGPVRHVRGNHPTEPTEVRLFVENLHGSSHGAWTTDCERCGVKETIVDPAHVVSVTKHEEKPSS